MVKLCYALVALMAGAVQMSAQEVAQKTQSKVSVEDGRSITVTGCVARNPDGGFMLTNVANKAGTLGSYMLTLEDDDDVKDHVGHRVEIEGKAADKGSGRIKVETKSETTAADGDKSKTTSTAEVKGDLKGLPYLGVKKVKMLASVCP